MLTFFFFYPQRQLSLHLVQRGHNIKFEKKNVLPTHFIQNRGTCYFNIPALMYKTTFNPKTATRAPFTHESIVYVVYVRYRYFSDSILIAISCSLDWIQYTNLY